MGGATSIDVTREGVDKAYGLTKLQSASGILLDAMLFVGDAIFPGGNDYPAKTLGLRSEEHTSELQSLMRISYAVFCLKKNKTTKHLQNEAPPYKTHNHNRQSKARQI